MFHRKLESYRFRLPLKKIWLIGSAQVKIKCRNLKNVHPEKKDAKDITVLFFMSTFYVFTSKIKTG